MEYKYAFYPTLLDSYFRYKRGEDELSFIQLFNKINQIPEEIVDEELEHNRLKGIHFEALINAIISGCDEAVQENGVYHSGGFEFNKKIVDKVANKVMMCSHKQYYQERIIETSKGKVLLYGIFDYKFPEMTVDLKVIKSYSYGKYKNNMQHKFASLISDDKEFNYIATDCDYMFIENYWLNDKVRNQAIKDIEEFIDFINHFKKFITDKKIFGF